MHHPRGGDHGGHDRFAFPSGSGNDDPNELDDDSSEIQEHASGSGTEDNDYHSGESSSVAAYEYQFEARQSNAANPVYRSKRHTTCGNPTPVTPGNEKKAPHWRLNAQQRLKTMQAALILCLNIGCDPPDVVKTTPCATLECWIDPYSMPPSKALETIGRNLQRQFEILNSKGKYKSYLDPSVDDFRNYMVSLRSRTKEERALVYYNGHGVPRPTSNGEFWVFNRNYTQYIPVSLNDFQDWIGSPSIFIWDCSAAGNILTNYKKFAEPKDEQMRQMYPDGNFPPEYTPLMDCLQLLACGANETLPMSPDLPADVFTACLTSPIEMALRFFVLQNKRYSPDIKLETLTKIPGSLKDRRSPLGELYWIFTAVTDTIAWSTFSNDIFRRLFRQDLVTASLFRHFLLAERVMRCYDCTPESYPKLIPTHTHKMWAAWDHAVDICLSRLPAYIEKLPPTPDPPPTSSDANAPPPPEEGPPLPEWPPNPFFEEHLTAFQVWLNRGSTPVEDAGMRYQPTATRASSDGGGSSGRGFMYHPSEAQQNTPRRPPYQLPVLLQVLLSQAHRLRALILLAQFVDLGPWAVHLALEIGIFPYVQRLLQSPAPDVKPLLIFIWARIFAVDGSCKVDLLQPVGYRYFAAVLASTNPTVPGANSLGGSVGPNNPNNPQLVNPSEHGAMCAFILAMMCRDHPSGQTHCFTDGVFDSALERLDDPDFFFRQWSALCIAQMWDAKDDIKAYGVERAAHDKLMEMLHDVSPEVRAAAMYALGTFLGASGSATDARRGGGGTGGLLPFDLRDQFRVEVAVGTRAMLAGRDDASPLVRKELVVLLSALVVEWRGWFVVAAWLYWEWDRLTRSGILKGESPGKGPAPFLDTNASGHDEFQSTISRWIKEASANDARAMRDPGPIQEENRVLLSSFFTILAALFDLSVDPYPEVAAMAQMVVDYIMALLVESAFARLPSSTLHDFPRRLQEEERNANLPKTPGPSPTPTVRSRAPSLQMSSLTPAVVAELQSALPYRRGSLQRSESSMSSTTLASLNLNLKRTASFAASLKNLATGAVPPPAPSEPSSPHTPIAASSFSHFTDSLPGAPPVPTPHTMSMEYVPPWSPEAVTKSLPTPATTPPPTSNKGQRDYLSVNDKDENRIKLSPSWSSLSPPNPSFAPSTLTFPAKKDRSHHNGHHHGSPGSHSSGLHDSRGRSSPTVLDSGRFTAFDVICALVAEDLGRQQTRQAQYMHGHGHGHGHGHAGNGFSGNGAPNGTRQNPLALGKIDTLADLLPLRSTLFDSCAEYYSEPQMKQPDVDEPGSNAYSVNMWRRLNNDDRAADAAKAAKVADFCPWDRNVATFNVDMSVSRLALHSSAPHMLAADDTNVVSIWDWETRRRLSVFSNANPLGSTITSLKFINEEDEESLVLTGSSDGVVRIYRNYAKSNSDLPVELVTSWRCLNDRVRGLKRGSGLVLDWQQEGGYLFASGDTRTVRIWDAHRELCLQEFPTHASASVTSITTDARSGTLFATGHADGSIHIFDTRLRSGALVRKMQVDGTSYRSSGGSSSGHHRSASTASTSGGGAAWIESVKWQKRGRGELVSGAKDGRVVVWDVRKGTPSAIKYPQQAHGQSSAGGAPRGLSGIAIHQEANVIVTASALTPTSWKQQTLSVDALPLYHSTTAAAPLTRMTFQTGLSHPPISQLDAPSAALVFHPFSMIYACGWTDGMVRLYGAKTEGVRPQRASIIQ